MTDTQETFAQLVGGLDYPMLIVTTQVDGQPVGCLVGFASQCSIDPARFLVCLSDKNRTYRAATRASALAVHVIDPDGGELARLFGSETQDQVDKFERCAWRSGPENLPILERCPRWFAGRIIETHRLGDHVGFVLDPFAASAPADANGAGGFLSFQQVKRLEPGHEA